VLTNRGIRATELTAATPQPTQQFLITGHVYQTTLWTASLLFDD